MSAPEDFALIEAVLFSLWAPDDVDPHAPAEVLNDMGEPQLTVWEVIRARRALERLRIPPGVS